MNKIAFPLKPGMQDGKVADLQDVLRQCLDRGILVLADDDEGARRKWAAALRRERDVQTYGDATRTLVRAFQEVYQLHATGEVDESTAKALNALLNEWGIPEAANGSRRYVVNGTVRREDGLPV